MPLSRSWLLQARGLFWIMESHWPLQQAFSRLGGLSSLKAPSPFPSLSRWPSPRPSEFKMPARDILFVGGRRNSSQGNATPTFPLADTDTIGQTGPLSFNPSLCPKLSIHVNDFCCLSREHDVPVTLHILRVIQWYFSVIKSAWIHRQFKAKNPSSSQRHRQGVRSFVSWWLQQTLGEEKELKLGTHLWERSHSHCCEESQLLRSSFNSPYSNANITCACQALEESKQVFAWTTACLPGKNTCLCGECHLGEVLVGKAYVPWKWWRGPGITCCRELGKRNPSKVSALK